MGFCCICFIVYMLCTYIARTKRNYHSQYIVIRKILICVHPLDSCCFSADLRAECQDVLLQMFSGKITTKHILIWAVCMAVGIFCSYHQRIICWRCLGSVAYANVDNQKFIKFWTDCLALYMDSNCFCRFGNDLLPMQKYSAYYYDTRSL